MVYRLSKNFPKQEVYRLTSQLQRAVISAPANIAEGFERNHRKEYVQFLYIAKGSLGEVETYLQLTHDLGYLNAPDYPAVSTMREDTSRILKGLIRSLESK